MRWLLVLMVGACAPDYSLLRGVRDGEATREAGTTSGNAVAADRNNAGGSPEDSRNAAGAGGAATEGGAWGGGGQGGAFPTDGGAGGPASPDAATVPDAPLDVGPDGAGGDAGGTGGQGGANDAGVSDGAACKLGDAPCGNRIPAGVKLLLSADSLALKEGDAVATWTDRSGSGNNASQNVSSRQPRFRAAVINGAPAIEFDGVDDALPFIGATVFNSLSAFVVYEIQAGPVTNGCYPLVLGGPENISGQYIGIETLNAASGDSEDVLDIFAGSGNDARATLRGISTVGKWHLIDWVTSGTIHSTTVRENGRDAVMTTTGMDVPLAAPLGDRAGIGWGAVGGAGNAEKLGAHQFRGRVAEIVVYDRALSATERLMVENYLRDKYRLF